MTAPGFRVGKRQENDGHGDNCLHVGVHVFRGQHQGRVVLDSPVRSKLFTQDRQNSNQVSENSCAEAVRSTPPSEVVWSE